MRRNIYFLVSLAGILLAWAALASEAPACRVVGWGFNGSGQATGLPTNDGIKAANTSRGVVAFGGQPIADATAIAAGGGHSLALKRDGTVFGWGWNGMGCAIGFETDEMGSTNGFVRIGGRILSNVTAIAAGMGYSLALQQDGTVFGYGQGLLGQRMSGPLLGSNTVAVSAGWLFESALALQRDRSVKALGTAEPVPTGLTNIVAIAAPCGPYWAPLALRGDHTVVVGMGRVEHPEMEPPLGLSNVLAVAAGDNHYVALKSDGTVFGWGQNNFGQITGTPTVTTPSTPATGLAAPGGTILSNVVAISASAGFSLALKRDGTVVAWGANHRGQCDVPAGLSGVVAIAAGSQYCLAITTNSSGLAIKK